MHASISTEVHMHPIKCVIVGNPGVGMQMYEVKHAQVSNCNQHNLRQDLPPDQLHHQLLPPRLHSHDI